MWKAIGTQTITVYINPLALNFNEMIMRIMIMDVTMMMMMMVLVGWGKEGVQG